MLELAPKNVVEQILLSTPDQSLPSKKNKLDESSIVIIYNVDDHNNDVAALASDHGGQLQFGSL